MDNSCSNKYNHLVTETPKEETRHGQRFDSLQQEAFLNLWRTYDRLRMLEDELYAQLLG